MSKHFDRIKKELVGLEGGEYVGSRKAVEWSLSIRKSGRTEKEMILAVWDNPTVSNEPMNHYLHQQVVFCTDEDVERIEKELLTD